jgi:Na+-driven multidrug efflux pump
MSGSAVLLMVAGIICSFMPSEIASFLFTGQSNSILYLFIQLIGALYFAFGMINWTAKGNLIGGIYGRPISVGNLTHFVIGGLAAVKAYFNDHSGIILSIALVYIFLGILFAVIFFSHPVKAHADVTKTI